MVLRLTLMRFLLDLVYSLGLVLAAPWLLLRPGIGGWHDLRSRFTVPAASPVTVWLHGSSVGEVRLIAPLVALFERRGVSVAISSHTATGVQSARLAYPDCTVFRFPFDFSFLQRKVILRLKPKLIIIVESDLWPNQLLAAERQGIDVALINAKLSEKSARLHRWSRVVPRAMRNIALIAAQTEVHAGRFRSLGIAADRIIVTGNMKYDLTVDDSDATRRTELRERLGFTNAACVVIGGSLHPQEDQDLIAAFSGSRSSNPDTRLIIVPRYPDQAGAVVQNLARAGYTAVTKSQLDNEGGREVGDDDVVVVDTLGELKAFYAASDIAFVGGSLYFRGSNKGGHNLMEPAILGLPVIFGPHNFSFRETVADLLEADAGVMVDDRAALADELARLVASPEQRAAIGRRARQVVIDGQGASERNLELLLPLLDSGAACSAQDDQAQCRHQPESRMVNE